jgi:hypothetical protein
MLLDTVCVQTHFKEVLVQGFSPILLQQYTVSLLFFCVLKFGLQELS